MCDNPDMPSDMSDDNQMYSAEYKNGKHYYYNCYIYMISPKSSAHIHLKLGNSYLATEEPMLWIFQIQTSLDYS